MIKIAHEAGGTQRKVHLGGWQRQYKDPRDEEYRIKLHGAFSATPSAVDNRPLCSPVEDQGELGSCTANMFAGLIESNEIRRTKGVLHARTSVPTVSVTSITTDTTGAISYQTKVTPVSAPAPTPTPAPALIRVSRLFEYYATRKIEGTTSEDAGASIRDTIKAGVQYGCVDEALYPYNINIFAQNPAQSVWTAAAAHKVTSYHSIADGDLATMKAALATGSLIGFGFSVYDYFLSAEMASKAVLNVPSSSESLQGGHAVCLVGYDDTKKAFLVRNSWSTGWGLAGYFWMSYDYVASSKLASDFWVVASAPI